MEEDYIDVGNWKRQYELALDRLEREPRVSDHNKSLLRRFVRDAAWGKTVERVDEKPAEAGAE